MDNLTSSIMITAAIGCAVWIGKQMVLRLLASITKLTDAVSELRLDVKEWSTVTEGVVKRVEKVESRIDDIHKGNSNGSYGSYPGKSNNGRK